MSVPVVANEVADRFHGLRRQYLLTRLGIAMCVAIAAMLAIWLLLSVLDFTLEWSLTVRTVAFSISVAGVVVWLMSRTVIITKNSRQKAFAGLLERSFDGFGQRIRTVLDTVSGQVSGPEEMLTALGNQTLGRWETLTPGTLIPKRGLLTSVAICVASAILFAGFYSQGSDYRVAMQRALGMDVPYTSLTVKPGDHRILEGEFVRVSLQLSGRTNRDVTLRYRQLPLQLPLAESTEEQPIEANWIENELTATLENEPNANNRTALFEAGIGNAIAPIEYQFVTSVGKTDVYRIDVQPLIELERLETLVQPPAYTKLEQRSFTTRKISALEGSVVAISVKTNHPLETATLKIGPKPSKLEAVAIEPGNDPFVWTFELPTLASVHWTFEGSGVDDTPMTPVEGRLRIRRDAAPKISWRDPVDEIKVHTLAEVPMTVQVADDYGIAEAGIVFQLGKDEDFVLNDWFVEDGDDVANTTRLKLNEILPLESFSLTERDFITYYAYAIDNREESPHRIESDIRYIDVRPLRQYFAEIEIDPMGSNGAPSLRVSLAEIIRRQRFLINRTRRLLQSTASSLAGQLGTIDRMVENQSELADLVRFLTEFLISRGNDDVEVLNQAEAAMLQASDSLAAASFDLALLQENDALLALAEARETLDQFLIKNPTPQQRRALARFNQQLRQKLRRERPKTERQLVDSLKQIAAQQNQLGQMVSQMQNQINLNGASGQGGGGNSAMKPADAQADSQKPNSSDSTNPAEESRNKTSEQDSGDASAQSSKAESGDTPDKQNNESSTGATQEDEQTDSSEPTMEEQQERLFERQIDLVERLLALEEELSPRLSESDLMNERMQDAKDMLDHLAKQARERQFEGFSGKSQDATDRLREMSTQLDALLGTEAVSRVSAIRDMTASMASMENELSKQSGGRKPSNSTEEFSGSKQPDGSKRLASRMQARAKTIEDVLRTPVEVGDVENSEVNDQLEQFAQETDFLTQLAASAEAAEEFLNQDTSSIPLPKSKSSEAQERAQEFAEAAMILDELYQQLVTPRLAKLRSLENQASQLANATESSGKSKTDEVNLETKAAIAALKQEFKKQGLNELAKLLDPQETPDEEIAKMLKDQMATSTNSAQASQWTLSRNQVAHARTTLVVKALRDRIQEAILTEISVDRDAAVPAEYENAVDGYFRTIGGEVNMNSGGSNQ